MRPAFRLAAVLVSLAPAPVRADAPTPADGPWDVPALLAAGDLLASAGRGQGIVGRAEDAVAADPAGAFAFDPSGHAIRTTELIGLNEMPVAVMPSGVSADSRIHGGHENTCRVYFLLTRSSPGVVHRV